MGTGWCANESNRDEGRVEAIGSYSVLEATAHGSTLRHGGTPGTD